MMAAKDRFDVHFERDYTPPEVSDWLETENALPGPLEPYFLRANTGPRWMLGGVMSRPFINASQCSGKFAISSIESSNQYAESPFKERWLTFENVDHCFIVTEGLLRVRLKGEEEWAEVREGQTLVISAGQAFMLEFASRYVRAISFTNGPGIEHLIHTAGQPYANFVLPDSVGSWDEDRLRVVCGEMGVQLDA
jgi:mannose-6-phosphate isomerase-like protein (cupin superfamily)